MAGSRRLRTLALLALPLPKGVGGRRAPKLLAGEGPAELFRGASGARWVLAVRRGEGGGRLGRGRCQEQSAAGEGRTLDLSPVWCWTPGAVVRGVRCKGRCPRLRPQCPGEKDRATGMLWGQLSSSWLLCAFLRAR